MTLASALDELDAVAGDLKAATAAVRALAALKLAEVSAAALVAMDPTCRTMLDSVANMRAGLRSLRTTILLTDNAEIEMRHLDLIEQAESLGRGLEALTINWARRVEDARNAIRQRAAL